MLRATEAAKFSWPQAAYWGRLLPRRAAFCRLFCSASALAERGLGTSRSLRLIKPIS